MRSRTYWITSRLRTCTMLATMAVAAMTSTAYAQKLNAPAGWQLFDPGTDNFNDYNVGWKWRAANRSELSKNKDGSYANGRFRSQNVQMDGQTVAIVNRYHNNALSEDGSTFNHSGAWLQSTANYFVEGQYQARLKVDWLSPDIWPAFWLWNNRSGNDELDIFEYQSGVANMSHHIHNPTNSSNRQWATWNTQGWEYNWAMTKVRTWNNWAARSTRHSQTTFYINGKKEHTSSLRPVSTTMSILFTSSPHNRHLPESGPLPNLRVDWVETHIP